MILKLINFILLLDMVL